MNNKVAAIATGAMVMLATTLPGNATEGAVNPISDAVKNQTANNQGLLARRYSNSSRTYTKRSTVVRNGVRRTVVCEYEEVNGRVYRNGCYYER